MIPIIFQALPNAEASRRAIQRARGSRFPKNVLLLEELAVDGQFASTLGDNPTPFLLADNKNYERIILFASQPCLRELAHAY